ncbi:MAG: GEVED domain-containing protein [Chitinophagales bacterium]
MRPNLYKHSKVLLLCFFSAFLQTTANAQYCTPVYDSLCTSNDFINNFSLSTLSNNGTGCNGNANNYINYAPAGSLTTTLELGSAYPIVMQSGSQWSQGFGVWIDYNNDNDFNDAGELIYASTFASTEQFTATVTIPTDPGFVGSRRMRVRCKYSSVILSGESCTQFTYGETEDYTVTVSPATTAMTYQSSEVIQTNFGSLGLGELDAEIIGIKVVTEGGLNPLDLTSLTINSNGTSNFANDIDAVKVYYTGSSPVFSADQLYAIVTDLSSPVIVNATLSPGENYFWVGYDIAASATIGDAIDAECTQILMTGSGGSKVPSVTAPSGFRVIDYCMPTYSNLCTSNDFIDNVTLNTLSNLATGCNGNLNNYIYYSPGGNLTTTLELGSNYTITLQAGQQWNQGIGVWIDFNNDLDFEDADEFVYFTPNVGTELFVGNVSVPNNTAYLGDHRMRIRCVYNYIPFSGDYCNNQQYGETEDYTITVAPSSIMQYISVTTVQNNINDVLNGATDQDIISIEVVTSGSIDAFNLTSLTINSNGTTNFANDVSNVKVYYTGADPVYSTGTLFGSSTNLANPITGNLALVSGVNHFWVAYDITAGASIGDYLDAECTQVVMTGNGGTHVPAVTAPVGNRQVGYCTASSLYGCINYFIDDVVLNTLTNVNSGCNGASNGYVKYPATGTNTTTLELGSVYLLSLEGPQFNSVGFGVWIDYNNDGDFDDTDEFVYASPFYTTGTQSAEITVPNDLAYLGERRIRVREKDYNIVYNYESCTEFYIGETEDYTINISVPTPMVYQSATTFQNNLNEVTIGEVDAEMMGIQVVMNGSIDPVDVFAFQLTAAGSTNFSNDVSNVKIYSSGVSPVFSTATFFGSSTDLSTPVYGAVTLNTGINYFWVTYDMSSAAALGNYVDVTCSQIQFTGVTGTKIPTVTAPTGSRQVGYCTASALYGCVYYFIDGVELNTLSNVFSGCNGAANGYVEYPATGNTTTSLEIGSNYPITLEGPAPYSYNAVGFGVWIDFNNDGDFDDVDEFVFSSPAYMTGTQSGLIDIPNNTAYEGERHMRIRARDYSVVNSTDACTTFYYGETEDYTVTIAPPSPMVFNSATAFQNNLAPVQLATSDAEIAGVKIQTSGSLNPFDLTSFTFNANGTTDFASDVTGVKVYYSGSDPNFSAGTLFGSATNLSSPITGSTTLAGGANYFWLAYDISSTATLGNFVDAECVSVTLNGTGGTHVPDVTAPSGSREINYCVGTYTNECIASGDYIDNFTLNTLSNLSTGCNGNADNYIKYNPDGNLTTTVMVGGTYDLSIQAGYQWNQGFGVWIDYNNDGSFDGADEFVYASPGSSTNWFYGTVTIPNVASYVGQRRMRVRCSYNSTVSSSGYCSQLSFGETEDYTITIDPQPPCTGTPEPGTLTITPDEFCITGTTASMDLTNYQLASNIVLEWQQSDNGSTWSPIPGVTSYTYTTAGLSATTYYRVKVTCTTSGLSSYTNSAVITLVPVPSAPIGVDGLRCGPGTVALYANGGGGDMYWYDEITGGNYLGTGSPFTTPYITGTTTFYVEESIGAAPASPLSTTFIGGNSSYGNMFDVTALNNLVVTGFDGHVDNLTTADIEIYYKAGTHVGFENDASAWTLAASATGVVGAGFGTATAYPVTLSVNISAGATYAFYITTSNYTLVQYSNGTGTGNIYTADENIQIKEGKGIEYPFSTYFEPRVWNGTLHYSAVGCASTRTPVKAVIYSPDISASATDNSICAGETISLNAQNNGQGSFNYQWGPLLSGMIPANGQAASVTVPPVVTTSFIVTATEASGQCDTSITVNVSVLPAPAVQLSGLNNSYEVVAPPVTLSGTPAGGTFSGPGVTGNTFDPAAAGVGGPYVISYTYTDANGCLGVDTELVTVTFPVGIDDPLSDKMISIYPNPGEGMIVLDINVSASISQLNLRVMNVLGQILFEESLNLNSRLLKKSFDFSEWSKGTYYFEIDADGQLIRKKLVIQ